VLKQFGDDSCKGNRPVVPSIICVPILVFTSRYSDSLHAFLRNFPCIKHTFYGKVSVSAMKFEPGLVLGVYGLEYITGCHLCQLRDPLVVCAADI